jgi:uncharacterized membrane protein YedE/YeeE
MGAVSDAVIMENFDRLRQLALALAVAIFGFGCMAYVGLINPLQSIYATKDLLWLSSLLGGLLFGWGMVWASGCGSKTLVRLGAGNLKALWVLLVMGVVALSAMKGVLAVGRVQYIDAAWPFCRRMVKQLFECFVACRYVGRGLYSLFALACVGP